MVCKCIHSLMIELIEKEEDDDEKCEDVGLDQLSDDTSHHINKIFHSSSKGLI